MKHRNKGKSILEFQPSTSCVTTVKFLDLIESLFPRLKMILIALFCFLDAVTKYLWQMQLKAERVYFSTQLMVQSIIAEKLRQQGLEAADHLTSTKKENRWMPTNAQLAFCTSYSPGSTAQEMVSTTTEMGLLTSINITEIIPCKHIQWPVSQVILDSIRSTASPATSTYTIGLLWGLGKVYKWSTNCPSWYTLDVW